MTQRLDEIKARLKAGTQGPIQGRSEVTYLGTAWVTAWVMYPQRGNGFLEAKLAVIASHGDAMLFRNSPADLAWLIAELEGATNAQLQAQQLLSHALDDKIAGCQVISHLKAELSEQSRLLGAGGSRELRLMTENAKLKAELEVACEGLREVSSEERGCNCLEEDEGGPYLCEYCIARDAIERMGRGGK